MGSVKFEGNKYRVGHLIENTNGYVACVDVYTKKVKRFYIDIGVETEQEDDHSRKRD